MFQWRITKYNPKYRNERGTYLKNEWISFSDIGKIFDQSKLTFDKYLKIENSYINAINYFMDCLKLDKIIVTNLRKKISAKKGIVFFRDDRNV